MIPIIIQTTYSDKNKAKLLGELLLKEGLCACIQIHKIDSLYKWKDEICEDEEYIVNIKTEKSNYTMIERKIKENHSYDLPEIIATEIVDGSAEYLKWLGENSNYDK